MILCQIWYNKQCMDFEVKMGVMKKYEKIFIFFANCIDDMRILVRILKDGGQVENVFLYLTAVFYTEIKAL